MSRIYCPADRTEKYRAIKPRSDVRHHAYRQPATSMEWGTTQMLMRESLKGVAVAR